MSVLAGFEVVQIGDGMAAAVCGRLFADVGARVVCIDGDPSTPLGATSQPWQDASFPAIGERGRGDRGRRSDRLRRPASRASRAAIRCRDALRRLNPTAAIVAISPFGQTGPKADDPATDLTLFFASGIARHADRPGRRSRRGADPPGRRAIGLYRRHRRRLRRHARGAGGPSPAPSIDVSIQEALATLAITELARAGLDRQELVAQAADRRQRRHGHASCRRATGTPRSRRATIISGPPGSTVMGSPDWGRRSALCHQARPGRQLGRAARADVGVEPRIRQAMRSPTWRRPRMCRAFRCANRRSSSIRRSSRIAASIGRSRSAGETVKAPGPPFGLRIAQARPSPRAAGTHGGDRCRSSGIRVLDFSWVIAGPTATRYLAAMGADVIKVEAPGRGDPGRASELHTVLGQAKRGIVLDLKKPEAIAIARALAAQIGCAGRELRDRRDGPARPRRRGLRGGQPGSASMSRPRGSGAPGRRRAPSPTARCCNAMPVSPGSTAIPGLPPRVGLAWLDPMCGLMLAFVVAAALWHRRRTGGVARIDFSMLEAMLWTMAEPLLAAQLGAPAAAGRQPLRPLCPARRLSLRRRRRLDRPRGHATTRNGRACAPSSRPWRRWPSSGSPSGRARRRDRRCSRRLGAAAGRRRRPPRELLRAGIPAAALATSRDLVDSAHLQRARVLGAAWRAASCPDCRGAPASAGLPAPRRASAPIRAAILRDLLGIAPDRIAELRRSGALG